LPVGNDVRERTPLNGHAADRAIVANADVINIDDLNVPNANAG
jgi:hypothetical protein